tara:strand:- start:1704 stop:2636 length:933 start_codon:yes stop_codon:yes gene_type:complete
MKLLQYLPLIRPLAIKALFKKLDFNGVMQILDLEDSIQDPFDHKKTFDLKTNARKNLYWLSEQKLNFKINNKVFVRINGFESQHHYNDLKVIKSIILNNNFKIDGIFLPKTENYKQIIKIQDYFSPLNGNLKLVPIIETKLGFKNLENLLRDDVENQLIYAVHYGHFDYCLDIESWPFPDPFHYEFWDIIDYLADILMRYNKLYIHTPFPFLKNTLFFWGSEKHLKERYKNLNFYLTSINLDISLSKKPYNLEKFKLKKMSRTNKYQKINANNIIDIFLKNKTNKRSFAISEKRFIPPHQYYMAKKFLNS